MEYATSNTSIILCNSEFWDQNLTWFTKTPVLTECFTQTVLPTLPLIILLTLLPYDLYNIRHFGQNSAPIPFQCRNIVILITNILLLIIQLIKLLTRLWNYFSSKNNLLIISELFSPTLKLITYSLVIILVLYFSKHGYKHPASIQIQWLFTVIVNSIILYQAHIKYELFINIFQMFEISFSILLLIISCLTPITTEFKTKSSKNDKKNDPNNEVNVFSQIFYIWITKILKYGYKTNTNIYNHLYSICLHQMSEYSQKLFESSELKYKRNKSMNSKKLLSIIWSIVWMPYICGAILVLCQIGSDFIQPYFFSKLIDFASNEDQYQWHGILYAFTYCLLNMLSRLMDCHYNMLFQTIEYRVKTALIIAVYKKMLKLRADLRQENSTGDLNTLVGWEIPEISSFMQYSYNLISNPIKISIGLYLLWQYLGRASLILFHVLIFFGTFTAFVTKRVNSLKSKQMVIEDIRMKQLSEIFSNIILLKLFRWEQPFIDRVSQTRDKELKLQKNINFCWTIIRMLFIVSPVLTLGLTFAIYTAFLNQALTPKTAFVSLLVLNIIRQPFVDFPDVLSQLMRAKASLKIISTYLSSEEMDETIHKINQNSCDLDIEMNDCSFAWSRDSKELLKHINLNIKKGSLVAIVGRVGSGKSSIFSAILGEMYQTVGSNLRISGTLAFVPQTVWMQNTNIRENIIFNNNFNLNKYEDVLYGCALKPDLNKLEARDMTKIGDKGINLSGGQKHRISLARAVYQNQDIYLLDDPLSAVDAQVAQHLFQEVIGPRGMLKNKTRLLATHNIKFLKYCDQIILMSTGRIVFSGSYSELIQNGFSLDDKSDDSDYNSNLIGFESNNNIPNLKQEQIVYHSMDDKIVMTQKSLNNDHEQQKYGKIGFEVYLEYFSYFGLFLTLVPLLTTIASNLCEIGNNYYLNIWSSQSSTETKDGSNKIQYFKTYLSIIIINAIFVALSQILFKFGSIKASKILHKKMLLSVMRAPISFFNLTPIGRIINRFNGDFKRIDNDIPMFVLNTTSSFIWFFIILAIIIFYKPLILIQTIFVIIIFVILYRYYLCTSRQLIRLDSDHRCPMYNHLNESKAGVLSIRAYCVQDKFIKKLQKILDNSINVNKHLKLTVTCVDLWSNILGNIISLSTSMFVVLKAEQLSPGFAGFVLIYSTDMVNSIAWALRSMANLETSMVFVERVKEYSELAECDTSVKKMPPNNWPTEGRIQFVNYSTRYRPGLDLVLKNLCFTIERGEKIGIVGRTGAGKSSITLALFRLLKPTSGQILIDDIDINYIGLHELRTKLTIIPQEPTLFAGTIKFNLDPFNQYKNEELLAVLQCSKLEQYFTNFCGGLSYEIREGSENLSVGQRQLICLARALLKDTKILVMDEATAACDPETDRLIQKIIKDKFNERTVITIAHRLNTIIDYNKILVLDNGVVVEMDSPNNLLKDRNSLFYSLAKENGDR